MDGCEYHGGARNQPGVFCRSTSGFHHEPSAVSSIHRAGYGESCSCFNGWAAATCIWGVLTELTGLGLQKTCSREEDVTAGPGVSGKGDVI